MESPTKKDVMPTEIQDPSSGNTERQDGPNRFQRPPAVNTESQPIPSTSYAPTTSDTEAQPKKDLNEMEEPTVRRDDEVDESDESETFNRYALTGRG